MHELSIVELKMSLKQRVMVSVCTKCLALYSEFVLAGLFKLGNRYREIVISGCCLVLFACGGVPAKTYEQPTGSDAAQCLQYCVAERSECRSVVQRKLDACKIFYQQELARYEYCKRVRVYGCRRPKESCATPQFNRCSDGYDVCFIGCGGKIVDPEGNAASEKF